MMSHILAIWSWARDSHWPCTDRIKSQPDLIRSRDEIAYIDTHPSWTRGLIGEIRERNRVGQWSASVSTVATDRTLIRPFTETQYTHTQSSTQWYTLCYRVRVLWKQANPPIHSYVYIITTTLYRGRDRLTVYIECHYLMVEGWRDKLCPYHYTVN